MQKFAREVGIVHNPHQTHFLINLRGKYLQDDLDVQLRPFLCHISIGKCFHGQSNVLVFYLGFLIHLISIPLNTFGKFSNGD